MKEDSPIKIRMQQIANHLNITSNALSVSIGKDRTYIGKIKGEITSDVMRRIYLTYPNINLIWLITGEGEMLNTDPSLIEHKEEVEKLRARIEELKEEVGYWKGKAGVDLKSEPA